MCCFAQVGYVSLELDSLLRQGREFTQKCLELPIQPPIVGCPGLQTSLKNETSLESRLLLQGNLLMRLINMGKKPESSMPCRSPSGEVEVEISEYQESSVFRNNADSG